MLHGGRDMDNALSFKTPTASDIDVLARTVYGEARGQPLQGQVQVAYTIIKRASVALDHVQKHGTPHPLFGDGSLTSACKAPLQYDCWMASDPNYAEVNSVTLGSPAFQLAMYAALGAVCRMQSNTFPLSTHYYNPQIVKTPPVWVTGKPASDGKPAVPPATRCGFIGKHLFFSGVA